MRYNFMIGQSDHELQWVEGTGRLPGVSIGVSDNVWQKYVRAHQTFLRAELQVLDNMRSELERIANDKYTPFSIVYEAKSILEYRLHLKEMLGGERQSTQDKPGDAR